MSAPFGCKVNSAPPALCPSDSNPLKHIFVQAWMYYYKETFSLVSEQRLIKGTFSWYLVSGYRLGRKEWSQLLVYGTVEHRLGSMWTASTPFFSDGEGGVFCHRCLSGIIATSHNFNLMLIDILTIGTDFVQTRDFIGYTHGCRHDWLSTLKGQCITLATLPWSGLGMTHSIIMGKGGTSALG